MDNSAIGITDILIDSISKKYDDVRDLHSLIVNLTEEDYDEIVPVINTIIEDDNNSIGKLQQLVDLLSGSEEDIEEGKQETIELIDTSDSVMESVTTMKKKLKLSENFDNVIDDVQAVADPVFVGANEEHDENKKKYEDAMKENKKEAEDTIPKEGDTGKKVKSKALKSMHLSEDLFSSARPGMTKVLELVDEGIADPRDVLDELVRYLPDNTVKEFIDYYAENFLGIFEDEDFNESLDDESILVTDIMWDVDADSKGVVLPTSVRVPAWMNEDEISDYLSDEYGFCHRGFSLPSDFLHESIQCSIAKEQIKRFNEGKMPKNWNVNSYLNKLVESKHITKKEAKSLREWYSRNK